MSEMMIPVTHIVVAIVFYSDCAREIDSRVADVVKN